MKHRGGWQDDVALGRAPDQRALVQGIDDADQFHLESDVLVFAHRDILRILIARWIALPALEARRLDLATASVSTLGYDHGLEEPVIRLLNDARRD